MKSTKFIEWENCFCLGYALRIPKPINLLEKKLFHEYMDAPTILYDTIVWDYNFNIAPKYIDAAIHKANRLFKYYTFKELPGAVIFLGSK